MRLIPVFFILQTLLSCNNHSKVQPSGVRKETRYEGGALLNKIYIVHPDTLLKDYNKWYNYTYFNVQLSQDFVGLDTDSARIDKTAFLNKLINERVVAFRIRLLQGEPVYKLYKLGNSNENIRSTSAQLASIEMKNYQMEGQQVPGFDFTDLNNNHYNTAATQGKILLLKCWFIHCVACVKEFPACNQLVDDYGGRNDVLFISLASDAKKDLEDFLPTKPFKFAVIPELGDYMTNKLKISMYPTYLLIDRTGRIAKVVNSIEEIKPFLKTAVEKLHDSTPAQHLHSQ
ncbi:MAG: TlpA family protein disulfide reductase [Williamsia sp.]|nr:TlpA family protein disulfide reductase [Williamsia sp.]